ncbi:MAG TPA: fluoride efflux transporter CrcB [Ignavibacteriales bacterium]|nr:fluoride efflux transporter CrcB [Ignavibacteriales bacterium]
MQNIILIGLGGFTGSVARYYLGGLVHKWLDLHDFPYGTVVVNIIGCIVIGFLGGLSESRAVFSPEARLFVFIGLLGGFTTFSTFGYDTFRMINSGQLMPAMLNVLVQVVFGVLSVWLGFLTSKLA